MGKCGFTYSNATQLQRAVYTIIYTVESVVDIVLFVVAPSSELPRRLGRSHTGHLTHPRVRWRCSERGLQVRGQSGSGICWMSLDLRVSHRV